jgi:cytochrome P450
MPMYWSSVHAAWVLTRYADVSAILRHPDSLALDVMPFLQALCRRGNLDLSSLVGFSSSLALLTRPPRHEAIRHLLAHALGEIRRMNLPELLERRADLLLACGERDGAIDQAGGYGRALALFVIGSFRCVPKDDLPELSGMAVDLMALFERILASVSTLNRVDQSAAALMDYFARLIDSRRRNATEDGATLLVRLAGEQMECSNEQLAGWCTLFFIAADSITAAGISEAVLMLLQRPLGARTSPAIQLGIHKLSASYYDRHRLCSMLHGSCVSISQ